VHRHGCGAVSAAPAGEGQHTSAATTTSAKVGALVRGVGRSGVMSITGDPASRRKQRRDAVHAVFWLFLGWGLVLAATVTAGRALTGPLKGSVGVDDNRAERWLGAHRSGWLTDVADVVSQLGETLTVLVLGPVLLLVIWLWTRQIRPVIFLGAALAGEVATYLVTVSIVSRPRPPVALLDPGLDPNHSYPSGHVAAAVALYGGTAVLLWLICANRRRWLSVPLAMLPPLVGIARLYLGAHHPSDVIASIAFMSAWLAVTRAVLLKTV
jgi:membrane-associated phospholipid phosphatase